DRPNLPAEFTRSRHFLRGTVGAARASDPNSANSQFFIMFAPAPSLDGQYTIWGQVVQGMEYVDEIKRGAPDNTLHLDLKQGRVVIQLLPEHAPMHVQQIKTLVRKGFYDGTVFHRVIE